MAEKDKARGRSGLAEAVAKSLYKLMAYKDEYEVGRLYSDGDFHKKLGAQFEGDYKLTFHLAPPLFADRDPTTGELKKREFGGWVMPLFRLLASMKHLRGGKLDVFGYTAERKMERALIRQYESDMRAVLPKLNDSTRDAIVALAALPLQIRGFGPVKQASEAKAAKRREELLGVIHAGGTQSARAAE